MFLTRFLVALIAILVAGLAGPAAAQSFVETEYTKTEIIAETNGFVPGETLWFAIRQDVREGWHVFWTNPGDAGLPLDLQWTLPAGFTAGGILHPVPEYIPVGPLASYAHQGKPVFLVPVTAPESLPAGETVDIRIDATWQTCEEICVPEDGHFEFSLPVINDAQKENQNAALFEAARARLPVSFDGEAAFRLRGGEYVLEAQAIDGFRKEDAFFFPDVEGLIVPSGEQGVTVAGDVVSIAMQPGYLEEYGEKQLVGILTFLDASGARRGVEITAEVAGPIVKPAWSPTLQAAGNANVSLLLAMALVGGLILNVMPCVFPILFVKAAALMHTPREDRSAMRQHGLLYTAGVLSTFLLIGGVLLALRAGGEQLGWGFHLQSPVVVALSAYVLFMVGLNLSGMYTVGESLAGSGQALAGHGGRLGAFFTGALAVVVAAPCIGPLLSAPLGAALLLPPAIGMLIFATLGLGLAAPYLALTAAPSLGRLLPRPGPWMKTLKQALAFPVFAAAAYFLWVFSQQSNGAGLAVMLSGALFLALAAWLFQISKGEGGRAFMVRALSAIVALAALAPLTRLEPAEAARSGDVSLGALRAEPYSTEVLEAYRAAGTPVFIDFTAAWCVTCQINNATVFSSRELARAFERNGVAVMVADWTVRDPEITAALQSFGASGVPLYVYYPAEGPAEILPLPLTRRAVMKAVSG